MQSIRGCHSAFGSMAVPCAAFSHLCTLYSDRHVEVSKYIVLVPIQSAIHFDLHPLVHIEPAGNHGNFLGTCRKLIGRSRRRVDNVARRSLEGHGYSNFNMKPVKLPFVLNGDPPADLTGHLTH